MENFTKELESIKTKSKITTRTIIDRFREQKTELLNWKRGQSKIHKVKHFVMG